MIKPRLNYQRQGYDPDEEIKIVLREENINKKINAAIKISL